MKSVGFGAFVLLVGIVLGSLVREAIPVAWSAPDGAAPGAPGRFVLETAQFSRGGGPGEVLFVLDQVEQRLALYAVSGTGLELLHVRNCTYDFKPNELNGKGRTSQPSFNEMKEMVK